MTDQVTGVPMMRDVPLRGRPITNQNNDAAISERHRKLRGTDELLYYPPEDACSHKCWLKDNNMGSREKPNWADHQCFYKPGHDGPCKFSSECIKSGVK